MGAALDRVLAACRERGQDVRNQGAEYVTLCPAHDDHKPSLSFRDAAGKVVMYCQVGCALQDIAAALNLPMTALFDEQSYTGKRGIVVAEYRYADEQGRLLYVKERRVPKDFRMKRPNGRGGWVTNEVFKGSEAPPKVLYRLPEVVEAVAKGHPVFVVEGEKDADNLAGRGYVATCNHEGAALPGQKPKWLPVYGDTLKDADVVIIADRDEAGYAHAAAIHADLTGKAKSVTVLQSAVDEPKSDVSDHFRAGYGIEDLLPVEFDHEQLHAISAPHLPGIPDYPVDALVGPLRELVLASKSAGLSPGLVGGAGLAALATAASMADLEIYDSWVERPSLWVPLIAPRGAGKSPAQDFAYRTLRDLNAASCQQFHDQLQIWNETPKKDRGPRPADTSLLVDDTTIEMIARFLARGNGTGSVDVDELRGWLESIGRYRSGGDGGERGRWLSLWSGAPWRYQRVSNDTELFVRRPVVTICGGLQPPYHHLLGSEDDGFRPRWLPHLVQLDTSLKQGKPGDTTQWDKVITTLYGSREARTWRMSTLAHNVWNAAQSRWKREAGGTETASVAAALIKADRQCARVALVIAESMAPGAGGEVSREVMECAVALVDYTLNCWRAMPDRDGLTLSRRDERLQEAVDALADWLEQHGGKADRRQLTRAKAAKCRTVAELNQVLAMYEEIYPGSVREERTGTRGPTGTVVYAPRRSPKRPLSETVDVDSSGNSHSGNAAEEPAGHSVIALRGRTVDTGDSSGGDSFPSTVTDIRERVRAVDIGPCVKCQTPTNRYGENSNPLCADCRAGGAA
ncbi:DUF3987 domain-containing protein [Sphaerisporangium sp. NPDC005288]|uniref:DUF3987 domain-containing protein n=1 Tax=Sphaerisporangium sp. NPDC005288 TaxID=3155114 RepID=UPI0033B048B6